MFNPKITFVPDLLNVHRHQEINLHNALADIKNGVYKELILALPDPLKQKDAYREAKKKLPCYAFAGTFDKEHGVVNAGFLQFSGIFVFDIDNLSPDQLKATRAILIAQAAILFIFTSPSGNGLKGATRVNETMVKNAVDFKLVFSAIAQYLLTLGVVIDGSGKDVRRLCFAGYDADLYFNQDAIESPVQASLDAYHKDVQRYLSLPLPDITLDNCEQYLPPWSEIKTREEWLKVGMALHHQFNGSGAALLLFNEWSSAKGSWGYEGYMDVEKRWHSFGKRKGPEYTFATLKWNYNNRIREDDNAVRVIDVGEGVNTYTYNLPDYPVELLNLPDKLGDLQQFIYGRMAYPSLATAGFMAIATVTAFVQTNLTIESRDGLGFNEYYMILAPTGFGKEDIRKPVTILNALTSELTEGVRLVYSAPSSPQGLHVLLEDNRSCYFMSDEFAEWLRLSHIDSHKQATLGYFMQAYSRALGVIEPGNVVTKKYTPVNNPRVSILATSTSEAMFDTMTMQQGEAGAYNRFSIFAGDTELPAKRYTGMVYKPEESLIGWVSWLKYLPAQPVKFSSSGFDAYMHLDTELAEPIKRRDAILGGRLGEQAIKQSGQFALADKRLIIEEQDVVKAFNIRIGLYHRAAALARVGGSLDGMHETTAALNQLVECCKGKKVYKSALAFISRKYAKLSLRDQQFVLETLVKRGFASEDVKSPKIIYFS